MLVAGLPNFQNFQQRAKQLWSSPKSGKAVRHCVDSSSPGRRVQKGFYLRCVLQVSSIDPALRFLRDHVSAPL